MSEFGNQHPILFGVLIFFGFVLLCLLVIFLAVKGGYLNFSRKSGKNSTSLTVDFSKRKPPGNQPAPAGIPIKTAALPPVVTVEPAPNFNDEISGIIARAKPVREDPLSERINKANELLSSKELRAAKKIFDSIQQRFPDCIEAQYGLAMVYDAYNDTVPAVKAYWETIKLDPAHAMAKASEKRIAEFRAAEAAKKDVGALISGKAETNIFYINEGPDPTSLARHFVALSNAEGGIIIIGLDAQTKQSTLQGNHANLPEILSRVWLDYINAPCLFELIDCSSPQCKLIKIYGGLNKPYRFVSVDGEIETFVLDGTGGIRNATLKEIRLMHSQKRG